jgi:hypothetical protein
MTTADPVELCTRQRLRSRFIRASSKNPPGHPPQTLHERQQQPRHQRPTHAITAPPGSVAVVTVKSRCPSPTIAGAVTPIFCRAWRLLGVASRVLSALPTTGQFARGLLSIAYDYLHNLKRRTAIGPAHYLPTSATRITGGLRPISDR